MHRSRDRSCLLICVAALLGACGSAPDAPQAAEAIISWSATARMIARRWHEGALPATFTGRALESVQHQLAQGRNAVCKSDLPASTRSSLSSASVQAEHTVVVIDSAVAKRDSAELLRGVAELTRQRRSLDSLYAALKPKR